MICKTGDSGVGDTEGVGDGLVATPPIFRISGVGRTTALPAELMESAFVDSPEETAAAGDAEGLFAGVAVGEGEAAAAAD